MSMDILVSGYIAGDNPEYKKHAAVLTACCEAGIEKLPEETAKFFNCTYPEKYLLKDVLEIELQKSKLVDADYAGYVIKVKDIPKECDYIEFKWC